MTRLWAKREEQIRGVMTQPPGCIAIFKGSLDLRSQPRV